MTKLIWFLLKAFVAVALTAAFGKWLFAYLNLPVPHTTDATLWGLGAIAGVTGFVIGMSAGLIVGENTGRHTRSYPDF